MATLNRRTFLLSAGGGAIALPAGRRAQAASPQSYGETMPDMLLQHVASKVNSYALSWDQQRERIHTAADAETRNRYVRDKFREMIHGLPDRTPLSPKTIATHDRAGYRVENVMFQSLPNFWVTGNLYIPTTGTGPFPGVISPCGHYPLARMDPEYQLVYIDLVLAGFVVLAYDPIGQGERRHYWNPDTGETEADASPVYEHSLPGQLLLLMGDDLTHYRVWDGMRAIDYLETRKEVDPQRIACAGHSGGGTLSLFISALDERVKCAVVNEGGTSARWPMHVRAGSKVGPADVEQNYFPGAKYGVDAPDLHIAIAPRPLMAMIEEYNPSFNRAADEIRRNYALLGAVEHFATEQANDPHSWTPKLRLATTHWLSRWLRNSPGPDREPDVTPETPATLYCTANGSVRYSRMGETIFSLILKKQEVLPPQRELTPTALAADVATLLRYRKTDTPLAPRALVTTPRKGYSVEKLEFLSEPDIYIPTWVFLPEQKARTYPTLLIFNESGKQADGLEFGLYERLARKGQMIIACDVRGIGETKPPHSPSIESGAFKQLFDVETAITYLTWYADESLFGMRVQDVMRSVTYALSRPDVDRQNFRVVGKGAGALWVLFAAVLDPRINDIVTERSLLSYGTLVRADRYTQPTGIFVRDILKTLDLPQLTASLAGRKLTLASPVDHLKRPVDMTTAKQCYAMTQAAFERARAGHFRIVDNTKDLYEAS